MIRKRRTKSPEARKTAGAWERLWMKRGAMAGATAVSVIAFLLACAYFPQVMAGAVLLFVFVATVAWYCITVAKDIDFSGDLKEGE